jgi:hypothetical protein
MPADLLEKLLNSFQLTESTRPGADQIIRQADMVELVAKLKLMHGSFKKTRQDSGANAGRCAACVNVGPWLETMSLLVLANNAMLVKIEFNSEEARASGYRNDHMLSALYYEVKGSGSKQL